MFSRSYVETIGLVIPLFLITAIGDVPVTAVEPFRPTATLSPDPPECVARYGQYLKDKYAGMPTLPDGDWPPSLGRQYTRLAMIQQKKELPGAQLVATMKKDYIHGNIDNIVKRKKAIQLPEVFLPTEDGGQQLKILMDGAPGVGKSTLSRKICKDWANGQLLQQYHLVILLPLRQASIREAKYIDGLIEADDPDLKQQVVRHIRRTSGEHVLLIVDGYDELSYKDRTQKSLILDILKRSKLHNCSVLVTSRPYASDYLQQLQSINRHVEVLGFTEEQIEHCIRENIPDIAKAIELVQALKERQDIASLCYIPLNCAFVLYVYEREQYTLPCTLTKLYEIFLLNAMRRCASIVGNESITVGLHALAEIPELFQKHLNALSKLAYDGLVVDKLVFSIKDIKAAFPEGSDLNKDINLLGLITVFKGFISTGKELSYQFLHLTIQEFLAASWAASQLSDGQLLKFLQDRLREERYRMVLLFLAGISQLKFPSAEHLFRDALNFTPSGLTEYSNRKIVDYFLFLAHLIYESQNFSLFHNLAGTIVGAELFAASYLIAPFDCLVLAHFLSLCDCSLKLLNLTNCGLTSESLEIMYRVNLEHHGTTQIEEVDLSSNTKMITKLSLLSKLPMLQHTKVLKVCSLLWQYHEGASCVVDLLCLLNMRHLTTLEISVQAPSRFFPPLDKMYLSLDKFWLENGNIDSQNAVGIFRSLEHNTSLKKLDLSENRQLAEDDSEAVGCAIDRMLNVNKTLRILNLSNCELDTAVATSIFTSLQHNTSLEELDLSENRQLAEDDSEAVGCAIDRTFNVNKTLRILNLSSCELDTAVATSIFRSLEHNTSLEELDLSENSQLTEGDSEAVGVAIERTLNVNRTLRILNLQGCGITDPIAKHISTGLINSTSLVILDIESPTLNISCAMSLLHQVITHPTLRTSVDEVNILGVGRVKMDKGTMLCENSLGPVFSLSLDTLQCQWMKIDGHYAVDIFRLLEHNTILEELDLSGNRQLAVGNSEAVSCAIERMLNVNRTLKIINLSSCELDTAVAASMFRSLENNTSLEELDLSENRRLAKGDCEAVGCAIERMLNVNRKLTVLSLHGCGITDPIAKHISTGLINNTSLVTLDIEPCTLSISCAVSLLTHPTVRISVDEVNILGVGRVKMDKETILCEHSFGPVFYFSLNILRCQRVNIDSQSAVDIFRSLEHNTSLVELDLSRNSQLAEGDNEAVGCAIERMLNVNRTLKVLNLTECGFTSEMASYFAIGLAQNCSVNKVVLHLNNIGSTGAVSIFRSLEHNTCLEELDLSGNSQLAEGDSEAVGCAIEKMLNVNRTLKVLNLNLCGCDSAVVTHIAAGLAHNASLAELNIGNSILNTIQNCSVNKVVLHLNNIGSTGAVSIFRSLEHNTSLEELDLSGNSQLAEDDSEAVGCAIERMLNVNKTLKVLNLYRCGLTNELASYFANGLSQSHSVRKVILHSNNIGSAGAVNIFRSLEHNTSCSLEELDLSRNSQLAEGGNEAVGCAIERMLSVNRTLKVLTLCSCKLDIEVATSIFRSLEHNTSLEELDLSGNSQLAEGDSEAVGCAIERMLNVNRTLKVLNLNLCGCDSAVVTHTAAGLAHNASLAELNIGNSIFSWNISSEGSVHLFKVLCNNMSLKKLDISVDHLGMEGSVALAEMLSCNKSLTELNLCWYYIPEDGLREIVRGLLQNTTLQTLTLWSSQDKTFLEAEMERLKKSGLFTPESLSRLEMKTENHMHYHHNIFF